MTPPTEHLAFVESPVQLLNVLEWTYARLAEPAAGAAGGARRSDAGGTPLTLVVLPPTDPMSRGQLRRMAGLARDEASPSTGRRRGAARLPAAHPAGARPAAAPREHVLIGDPFSRYVQLLLSLFPPRRLTVVDDGTATMEYAERLSTGSGSCAGTAGRAAAPASWPWPR